MLAGELRVGWGLSRLPPLLRPQVAAAGSGVGLGRRDWRGVGVAGQRPHGSSHSGPASGRRRGASRGRQRTGNAAGGLAGSRHRPDRQGPPPQTQRGRARCPARAGDRGDGAQPGACVPQQHSCPGPLGACLPRGLQSGRNELIQGPDGIKAGSPHQGHVSHLTVMVPGCGVSSHFDGTGPESVTPWEPLPHPQPLWSPGSPPTLAHHLVLKLGPPPTLPGFPTPASFSSGPSVPGPDPLSPSHTHPNPQGHPSTKTPLLGHGPPGPASQAWTPASSQA